MKYKSVTWAVEGVLKILNWVYLKYKKKVKEVVIKMLIRVCVRCACGVKHVRWVTMRLSVCYQLIQCPSPSLLSSVRLNRRQTLPLNSLLTSQSSLVTRCLAFSFWSIRLCFFCWYEVWLSGLGVYRIRYSVHIVFGLNTRPNSVFVFGWMVVQNICQIWMNISCCTLAPAWRLEGKLSLEPDIVST